MHESQIEKPNFISQTLEALFFTNLMKLPHLLARKKWGIKLLITTNHTLSHLMNIWRLCNKKIWIEGNQKKLESKKIRKGRKIKKKEELNPLTWFNK